MKIRFMLIVVLFFSSCATSERGNVSLDRNFDIVAKDANKEYRTALVIGNKSYTNLSTLENPINDASDMRDILTQKGFDVIYLPDASQLEMEQGIEDFSNRLRVKKGIGLFYYAGHGVELQGTNYLIPSHAKILSPNFIRSKSVSVDAVTSAMKYAKNRFNILILDACRSNPLSGRGNGGLAIPNDATGVYIAYATAPGRTAEDGQKGNGLFTKYLKQYMNIKGLEIADVFKNVGREVQKESKGRQTPWTSSSVYGDFYFTLPTQPSVPSFIPPIPKKRIIASTSKWITPTKSICESNGGEIDKHGICEARWDEAKKICSASGGTLPSLEVLGQVVSDCGGVFHEWKLFDDRIYELNEKNRQNSAYQACYKQKGFVSSDAYWSSTTATYANDSSYAWLVSFNSGDQHHGNKSNDYSVRCVRAGQ